MNIDFIKWMVGYADRFEIFEPLGDDIGIVKVKPKYRTWRIKDIEKWEHYPLLLQRTIEGVEEKANLEVLTYKSRKVDGYTYQVFTAVPTDDFPKVEMWGEGCPNVDQAKEQALKYIYEQETK